MTTPSNLISLAAVALLTTAIACGAGDKANGNVFAPAQE